MVSEAQIAWLAGIIDGEGCFSIKRPIQRKSGKRVGYRTSYQVWLVLCNTSQSMVERTSEILDTLGIGHQPIREVWKGKGATRYQYWLHIARKNELLQLTEILLPHLVAKRDEALVVAWYLRRACRSKVYRTTTLDRAMLDAMSEIKRNGGEAPAHVMEMMREVIPSEAMSGTGATAGGDVERVETRSVSPNNNPIHECPGPQQN